MKSITAMFTQHPPEKTAIQTADEVISYGDWQERVFRTADWIDSFAPGNAPIGIFMPAGSAFLQLFTGIAAAGKAAVPLDTKWKEAELAQRIELASPAAVIAPRRLADKLAFTQTPVVIWEDVQDKIRTADPQRQFHFDAETLFYIGFTSGTTGTPKAFARSHASWLESFTCSRECLQQDADEHVLVPGSLVHSHFLYGAVSTLFFGGTLYLLERFSPIQALAQIDAYPISTVFIVPTMAEAMLSEQMTLTNKLAFISSGAKWHNGSKQRIQQQFPNAELFEFYGASELSFVSVLKNAGSTIDSRAVGMPFHNVEIEIRTEDETIAAPNETGKIFVRSRMIFSGYLNPVTKAVESIQDENGWITVDDMGYIDQTGLLHIAGRQKGMILSGGVNIFPEEIEAVLLKHEGVEEAAVVGLEDDYWGQIPAAVIAGRASEKELKKLCLANLSAYKLPRKWFFFEQLPYTASGKIARAAVKELIESAVIH